MITALYAGILAIFLVILVFNVIRFRLKNKIGLGDGGIPELHQAIRVHGNFTEIVPVLLILMVIMEQSLISPAFLHIFGITIVISRILHFIGLSQSAFRSWGRTAGTIIAMLLMLVGGITCIYVFAT